MRTLVLLAPLLALLSSLAFAQSSPKTGGTLRFMHREDLRKLEEDAARPVMGWRIDRFAHHAYVKNLIPHQVVYNCCRLQDVWVDR